MASLTVATLNITNHQLPSLGAYKTLCNLGEKSVTKAVREVLYQLYGVAPVDTSCTALKNVNACRWEGRCEVNGQSHDFVVQ